MSGKAGGGAKGSKGSKGRQGQQGGKRQPGGQRQAGGAPGPSGGKRQFGSGATAPPDYRDGDHWFKVQKVRGKLQSGAITGLSHFRGQGAKGDAPQEFIEALEAAKQDATDPIELDRIPADARNMVKQYFDRLTKDANARSAKPMVAPTPPKEETFDSTQPLEE